MRYLRFCCLSILACVGFNTTSALATGDCFDYTDLTGQELPITVEATTADATGDYGPFAEQPACWQGNWDELCAASQDITFKWTAPHDGRFTFTLLGTSGYAELLLYDFTCPAEPLYPDDFLCGAHRNQQNCATLWEIELLAGQEVLIVLDGYFSWNGSAVLSIYDTTTLNDVVDMIMVLNHYPAVSAMCAWSGSGRWRNSFGLADFDGDVPLRDDHLLDGAWLTPVVLGVAMMQLWEDDHFALDDDVNDYTLPFDVRHPVHSDIPITFRMLMSHVSGIANNPAMYNETIVHDGDATVTPCEFMEGYVTPGGDYYDAAANFTSGAPGTVYVYSKANLTLLACLIEHINPEALSFEDYCRTQIFDPLQMPASTFLHSRVAPRDLVTHYQLIGESYYALEWNSMSVYPADGLYTNARELSRLMLAVLQGGELYGERILETATVDSMLTDQYPELSPGTILQGLVWISYADVDGRWFWGLGGGNFRSQTGLWIDRDEGIGVIALTNCGGSSGYVGPVDILSAETRRALEWTEAVGVPDGPPATPALAQLGSCYPNPFNPQTTINLSFTRELWAEVGVYDLTGKAVAIIADRQFVTGPHTLTWHGVDAKGRAVPSGTYIVRLETDSGVEARKVMLVR